MTYSDYRKVLKQLKAKPAKLQKYMRHNAPKQRKYGRAIKKAHISKYGLSLCRTCFREIATNLGFKKYN